MIETMAPVVLTLKQLREEAGLTQAELADAVGVRQPTISALETGRSRRIEFDLLDALCEVLTRKIGRRITPGDLLERQPAPRRGRR